MKNDAAMARLVVSADDDGQMASLVIDYAAARCDISSKYDYGKRSNVISFECASREMMAFIRYLEYASTAILSSGLPRTDVPLHPLPTLLSHALLAFKDEYDRMSEFKRLPALATWSNILQLLDSDPISTQSIRKRINISRRVLKIASDTLVQLHWIELKRDKSSSRYQLVNLTGEGETLKAVAAEAVREVEAKWVRRFGAETIDSLRTGLIGIASQIELELPHYCVGYGVADQSITGGSPYGNEWPNVPRDPEVNVTELPLPSLLSKVLAAFTIEYESHGLGGLAWASQCLVHMSDNTMNLGDVRKYGIAGIGTSAPERHLSVVVAPGRSSDDSRKVYVTPKSRLSRDSYPALLTKVQENWRNTYGADLMANLRETLLKIDQDTPEDMPDYPDTAHWLKYPQKVHHQPVYAFKKDPSPYEKWGDVVTTCYAGRAA